MGGEARMRHHHGSPPGLVRCSVDMNEVGSLSEVCEKHKHTHGPVYVGHACMPWPQDWCTSLLKEKLAVVAPTNRALTVTRNDALTPSWRHAVRMCSSGSAAMEHACTRAASCNYNHDEN